MVGLSVQFVIDATYVHGCAVLYFIKCSAIVYSWNVSIIWCIVNDENDKAKDLNNPWVNKTEMIIVFVCFCFSFGAMMLQ